MDPNIYLVMGSDSFFSFQKWKDYLTLLSVVKLCVLMRTNQSISYFKHYFLSHISDNDIYLKNIKFIQNNIIPISSTKIRESIYDQQFSEYLPQDVLTYILDNGLYYKGAGQ